jgi:hypothetical protein
MEGRSPLPATVGVKSTASSASRRVSAPTSPVAAATWKAFESARASVSVAG